MPARVATLPGVTLRARVAVLAAVGALAVVVAGIVIGLRFADTVQAANTVIDVLQPAADDADTLVVARVETEGDLQDYVLTGETRFLVEFRRDLAVADEALARLDDRIPGGTPAAGLVSRAKLAREAWWEADAAPTIAAVQSGDLARAAEITQSDKAWAAYREFIDSAEALQDAIDDQREQVFRDLADFNRQLAVALAASGIVLLLLLALLYLALRSWVLRPLDLLRRQLRAVARRGEHHRPIEPAGPPELEAAGTDAERMRRQLVTEIDEARAAREALAQDAPVVAAIRRELRATGDPGVPGLRVFGALQPAEGVLAGDWWDTVRRPDGTLAVVVTDVSGHGPAAGIAAMRVRTSVTSALAAGRAPDRALTEAAPGFADEDARFATVAVAVLPPGPGDLRWANAGHPAPVLVRADGSVERLEPTGPLLSCLGGTWETRTVPVAADDVLLLFTDGLVESRDRGGAELGDDELVAVLRQAAADADGAEDLVARVLARVRDRAADWRRDDVTLVAVRIEDAAAAG